MIIITSMITTTTATSMATTTTTTITAIATTMRMRPMAASAEPPGAAAPFKELPLLVWLSPAFPVGSFAYSHGLEWAAEAGDIVDAATLKRWLIDLIELGAPRADCLLFAAAFRATERADWAELAAINELAIALAGSSERRLETSAQGGAFAAAMRAAWPCPALERLPAQGEDPIAYPIAVAVAAAGHGLDLASSLEAFGLALLANLVSAAVRLGTIGQTDGQKTLAALMPEVRALAHHAAGAGLEALGGCAIRSDIAAMRHETQYSRLFRS
jgi:urease accessory protein